MSKIAVIGIVGESVFLSVDAFGKTGETAVATGFHRELGGKGFNQALAARRYGASVSFLGAICRRDVPAFTAEAKALGITPFFAPKEERSPYAVITTDKEGDNRVLVYRGAALAPEDVDAFAVEIASADLLLINNEVPESVNERAVALAKEKGVRVLLNPAPYRPLPPSFLSQIDLFTPNEHETAGLDAYENQVITLGSKGCFIKPLSLALPAVELAAAVDTTGAGDTFSGVLAACLAEGLDLRTACEKASIASAIEVGRRYVINSIPTREEIEKY
ncbi:MAG: ribokinase [Clostridia bacterium]|nr:ribokinase [Clostridia bacterium]